MQENLERAPDDRVTQGEGRFGAWLSGLPGRWGLVVIGVSSILTTLVLFDPQADPDLFARVAVGRLVAINGGVTDQDPFAFTPLRDRWIDHEWLAGVVFYRVAELAGEWGLVAFAVLGMIAMVLVVVRAQHELSGASLGWSVLTLLHLFVAWSSIVRSRAFTLVFAGLLLFVLVRWRSGRPAWLWLLPPCFLVWANAHGGFVAGLGLLGAAAGAVTLRERRRAVPLWTCLAACLAVTFVNPYGLAYWRYILEATSMERSGILEWQTLQGWQVGLLAVLGGIYLSGVALRWRTHRPLPEVVGLLAVSTWAAVDSQRLVNFLLLVLAVYGAAEYRAVIGSIGGLLANGYRVAARHLAGVLTLSAPVVLFGLSVSYLVRFASSGLGYDIFPVGAVEWLAQRGAGGRLLTHFNHGSFALWRLYPLYQVAVDGRYEETYPEETVQLAWTALQPNAPGHEEALRRVAPDYILVPGADWARDFGPPWVVVYQDPVSAVLARPGLATASQRPSRPMWTPGF